MDEQLISHNGLAAQANMQATMQRRYANVSNQLAAGNAAVPPRPQRRLDSIASAADETARIASRLDNILARFTGTDTCAGGCEDPIAISYSTQLDRLQANLGRIHKTIDEIEQYA